MVIFPLTFLSSAFAPAESMPVALETFAEVNPITSIVDAMRALWVDAPANSDLWVAPLWCVGLTLLFATLSVARYRRAVRS